MSSEAPTRARPCVGSDSDQADRMTVEEEAVKRAIRNPERVAIVKAVQASKDGLSPNAYTQRQRSKLNIAGYHFRVLVKLGVLEVTRVVPGRGGRPEHFHELVGPLAPAVLQVIDDN